ncbi:MAG: hypothetical protein PVH64_13475 [Bacillota bacterium]|jgi:L-ribulose-5-phosphate 3-epimerase
MKLSYELWPNDPYDRMGSTGVAMNSWGNLPLEDCIDHVAKYGYEGHYITAASIYMKLPT